MAHTPGPWHVGSLPPPRWRYICSADGETIASVADWNDQGQLVQEFTDKAQANARLIAAAPELLKQAKEFDRLSLVIESAVRNADPPHREGVLLAIKAIRAAIAKAEGRP